MPKKSAKKYVLPEPLPNGEVIHDIAKKNWIIGPSIGVGGFGEIYSAAEYSEGVKKPLNYQFVVKIEPHENGPLFCEINFFRRIAKAEMIKIWCTENKIASLGMPKYLGSGSHEHGNKKYRFLVLDRYGKDLWRIFLDNKKQFPVSTVYRISLQLLDVLQYIHSNDYVHADIKGANILLGLTKQTQNQVFLVDFGLATKYTKKDFKPDPRRAHNGTIEYTSCDAHEGVPTRRGDIEILAYNMIHWMGTVLPWETFLTDPVLVHNSKKKNLADVSGFLKSCFGQRKIPGALKEFIEYVTTMNYDTAPDYKKLHNILLKGLKTEGGSATGALEFKTISKHKSEENIQSESETPEKRRKLTPKQTNAGTSKHRGKRAVEQEVFNIDSESDEENIPIKKTRARPKKRENISNSESEEEVKTPRGRKKENSEPANGYNAEMLRLQKKIAERKAGKLKKTVKKSRDPSPTSKNELNSNLDSSDSDVIPDTPPKKLAVKTKRKVNTPTVNGGSESPRTLRQRR